MLADRSTYRNVALQQVLARIRAYATVAAPYGP